MDYLVGGCRRGVITRFGTTVFDQEGSNVYTACAMLHVADSHAGIPVEFTISTSALADAKFGSQGEGLCHG